MQENIITAIYHKYLDNAFEGIHAISPESQAAREALEKFENKHHISAEERNDIEDNIIAEVTCTSERKGFVSGFKIAVRLMSEVYSNEKNMERTDFL